ncbi:hypothetical protein BIW11_06614 [Tropilaelaps mercedesae]|uniref:Nucleolar pre-ribosomal-associated protein 1-like n=1 Tax=Tropilaelaps mercedesae TaxID=418985 RepID=A0A1V9XXP0_9ACAR|nr:hypothetical protein BIW11_06614 [Tropilaelaps mercedesae]
MAFKEADEHVSQSGGDRKRKKTNVAESQASDDRHEKRKKEVGFFDLGFFVEKIKARDITIFEQLARFSESAQNFQETKASIDVVREFLQMCDCDLEHLVSYIDIVGADKECLLPVLVALDHVFLRFQEQDDETATVANLRTKVIIQAQKILSQQGPQLTNLLADNSDPVIMKRVLKLFTSMVLVGAEVADVLVQSVDLSFFNGCFTRIRIRETISIRTCTQYLLIALLVISKRVTLWRLLEQRSLFPWAFAGLVHDRPADVIGFLEAICERVVDNPSLSKSLKMNVLNKTTLTPVMSLVIWKGQLEWRGKEWSRVFLYTKKSKESDTAALIRGNELIMAAPAEQESVRASASKLLAKVFFNTKQGVSFRDPRLGFGERNCNFIVTQVVCSCPQVFSEPQGADFLANLLVALPDQIKYIIVDRYYNFRSAKLSRTHCNFYRALAKVVTELNFNQLVERLEPSSADQYVDLVKHFCLFLFIPADLTEDYSLTSIYSILNFMNAMIKKLVEFMMTLNRETRRVLVPFIKDHLIPPQTLASLMKRQFSGEQITTLTEYTGADISEFTLKLLDTMHLLASPVLGYISATIGWDLVADVEGFVQGKVSVVKKSRIYLRLIRMVLSFLPNFESELVKTNMKPLRLLFGLLAEASTDPTFQVELLSHAIDILKRFSRLVKHGVELELWVSTVLASDQPEVNHAYSMALCDAVRDCIAKGEAFQEDMEECLGTEFVSSVTPQFSPISGSIAALDAAKYPVFTAVMREILHRQINYTAYIKFIQKYGQNSLDKRFMQYMNFLLTGEKPFVNKSSDSVEKFSSEAAMHLESAFVSSMTGGHPKSLERVMVKTRFTDQDAVNVSLLSQLVLIIRWCQDHDRTVFINPVATCLRNLADACDLSTLSRLADFLSSDVIQKHFCTKGDSETTLMVFTIVRRLIEHKLDIGFDLESFKQRALAAVLNGIVDVPPFVETFGELCIAEDVAALVEFVCRPGRDDDRSMHSVLPLLRQKHCRLSTETTKQLLELAYRNSSMRPAIEAFMNHSSMHAAAIDVNSLWRLVGAEASVALVVLAANPCFVRAIEKKLRSAGDLTGSSYVYSLELLRLIAHEDRENPSKETSAFVNRSLLANVKKCLEDAEPHDERTVAVLVQDLLDHLRHVVFIFVKDYAKLLKTALPFVERPTIRLLVILNAVLEFGDLLEDAMIAVWKCLLKLAADVDETTEMYVSRTVTILKKLPNSAWKSPWLKENFEKIFKGLLKKGFTTSGIPLILLRSLFSNAYKAASPELTALEATEMVFGHSKFLPTLTGKDTPLKQQLVQLLITLVQLDGPNVCKTPHLPILLSGYDASLSLSDQHLYHLLTLYERNGANLALFQPLIWGEAAPSYYSIDKGTAAVSVLKNATINQLLSQISQQRLLRSVENVPEHSLGLDPAMVVQVDQGAEIYDPRFVQTNVLHLIDELSEMQTIRLIEEKIPLLSIATLAAECSDLRSLGYTLLSRIYMKMQRVSSHPVVMYMMAIMDLLRNSLGSEGARKLNTVTVGYLIRCCEVVISDPNNPLYNQLIRSSLARPAFNVQRLPPLLNHFINSSMASRERRRWIESILTDFMRSSRDMEMLHSQGLLDNIISFAQSPLCDEVELVIILQMFKAWIARNRFKRYNLLVLWLGQLLRRTDMVSIPRQL